MTRPLTSKTPLPARPTDIMESERISVRKLLNTAGPDRAERDAVCASRVSDIVQRRLLPALNVLRAQLEEMRVHGVDCDALIARAENSVGREFGSLAVDLGTILNLGAHDRAAEEEADTAEAAIFAASPHYKLAQAKLAAAERRKAEEANTTTK